MASKRKTNPHEGMFDSLVLEKVSTLFFKDTVTHGMIYGALLGLLIKYTSRKIFTGQGILLGTPCPWDEFRVQRGFPHTTVTSLVTFLPNGSTATRILPTIKHWQHLLKVKQMFLK